MAADPPGTLTLAQATTQDQKPQTKKSMSHKDMSATQKGARHQQTPADNNSSALNACQLLAASERQACMDKALHPGG
jgi:hypothetical protein